MATTLPVALEARLVGRKSASEFTPDGASQAIVVPEKLQFLADLGERGVSLFEVSARHLDNARPAIDHSTIKDGDRVRLQGVVSIPDFGEVDRQGRPRGAFLRIESAEVLSAEVRQVPQAKAS